MFFICRVLRLSMSGFGSETVKKGVLCVRIGWDVLKVLVKKDKSYNWYQIKGAVISLLF